MLRYSIAQRCARELLQLDEPARSTPRAGVTIQRTGRQEVIAVSAARGGAAALRMLARKKGS